MTHFKNVCECGILMGQCRCPSKDKVTKVISPCIHHSVEKIQNEVFDSPVSVYDQDAENV